MDSSLRKFCHWYGRLILRSQSLLSGSGNVKLHEVRVGNEQEALPVFIREEPKPAGFCLWPFSCGVGTYCCSASAFVVPDKCPVISVTVVSSGPRPEILQLIHVRREP